MKTKDKAFLIKLASRANDDLQFNTIGGFHCTEIITPQPPEDRDRDIVIKANGVFVSGLSESEAKTFSQEGSLQEYELTWETGKRQRGSFIIEVDYAGQFNDCRSFNVTLKGVGKCYDINS